MLDEKCKIPECMTVEDIEQICREQNVDIVVTDGKYMQFNFNR